MIIIQMEAINDFVIQIGDRTIVLSIAGKGHHDKYDSFLFELTLK